MKCEFSIGDLVRPRYAYKDLNKFYFHDNCGEVIDVRKVNLSYENYFVKVKIVWEYPHGNIIQEKEFYSQALEKV